jgi:ATP:ADP antiporter, AAA family
VTDRSDRSFLIAVAMSGAAFTMACQVAGKAARDALFLSHFGARHLPAIVIAAAITSIFLGLLNARILARYAPARVIPILMIGSAALQAVEWFCYESYPRSTAVAVYIHVVSLGAVITSGFWSVVNEQLDPYTAKQNFGRIAAAGTGGGVAGGFAAERLAALASSESVLLFLCVGQLGAGILLSCLPRTEAHEESSTIRAIDVLRRSAYLRNLTYLVVLGTFSAALLDYVMKAEAKHTIGPGEPLLRFFAMYHTGTSLFAFLAQTLITPRFLSRWGLGASVATLPATVAGGGLFATVTGGLPAIVFARGMEAIIRGSIFRAGYELFYTPMLASEKRALKTVNAVAVDRLGDGLGGGFAQMVITTLPVLANSVLLSAAAVASGGGWFVARRLNHAYIKSLERGLRHRAADLDLLEDDASVPSTASVSGLFDTQPMLLKKASPLAPPTYLSYRDRQQWTELFSGDRTRMQKALQQEHPLDRALIPHVVPLLARRSLTTHAQRALEAVAADNVGQLSDFLLDPETPVAVRCKLPHIIACAGGERAADGLVRGLADKHFEVRFECSRALQSMKRATGVGADPERVFEAVRRELVVSPDLEYVFALIASVLPPEPVRVAFEALGTDDDQLRGLAFEYLESALPPDIGKLLLAAVKKHIRESDAQRPKEDIRQDLLSVVRSKQQTR